MNPATQDPALQSQDREFVFSVKDFERVRTLIYQHAGIHLHEGKQAMVYSRLSRRLRRRSTSPLTATSSGWSRPPETRAHASGRSLSTA